MDRDLAGFQLLVPGKPIEGDWCNFPVPGNMTVGVNTVIDSSACFKRFFSTLPLALKLGDNITLEGASLATESNGYIEIGDSSYICGASIACNLRVIIGRYVYIAAGVTIVDTDFHPSDPGQRLQDTIAISTVGDKSKRPSFNSLPVLIEDDVWIGFNATILKGVTIGKGAVIEAGAVISKDVPAGATAFGNPAIIKPAEHA